MQDNAPGRCRARQYYGGETRSPLPLVRNDRGHPEGAVKSVRRNFQFQRWKRADPDQRVKPGRPFNHRRKMESSAFTAERTRAGADLSLSAVTFVCLQEKRHQADDDLKCRVPDSRRRLFMQALPKLAFPGREGIREHEAVQDYLFALL